MSETTEKQAQLNVKNTDEFLKQIGNGEGMFKCVTLWLDLLDFRRHMDLNNWGLDKSSTQLGLKRIVAFHETALLAMDDRYEVVQMNDAIVISQDIEGDKTNVVVEEFLALADRTFEISALTDSKVGGCGVRGVIAVGARCNLRANMGWIENGKHDVANAAFFCPRPIMMNMAFGRAYGVESSHQLDKESSLYVEEVLTSDYGARLMETWTLGDPIEIDNFGRFLKVRSDEF